MTDQTNDLLRDLAVLARVGRLYLDALDNDPEHEQLSAAEAMLVTEVRDAVERQERRARDDR